MLALNSIAPKTIRPEPLDVLQEHRLPLAVGADDRVVEGHRQFDDRVEPRERSVPREQLLDRHPRVARAEDVHEPALQDRAGEVVGRRADRVELRRFDGIQRREDIALREVTTSNVQGA